MATPQGVAMLDFFLLAQNCAPSIEPQMLAAIVSVESGFNPFAIGVVGGRLERQPKNMDEALATANALQQGGWNFSLGLAQVNHANLKQHGLTYETAFDGCANLRASAAILNDCLTRATRQYGEQGALEHALSCYYSGDFTRGLLAEGWQPSYAQKVLAQLDGGQPVQQAQPIAVIPSSSPTQKSQIPKNAITPQTLKFPYYLDAEPMMYPTEQPLPPAESGREAETKNNLLENQNNIF
jgi:type IV secretion system protein VirB1